jgi:hypothetical protein
VTKLLQCLRDELVRRDYAATTIRSYIQIVEAFRQHAVRASIGSRQPSSDATTCSSSRNAVWRSGRWSRRSARCGSSAGTS